MSPLSTPDASALPLAGVRVLELSDGRGEMCARVLADLGAEVTLVEPPTGSRARRMPPLVDGHSLYFASHNANKRSAVLDLSTPGGREALLARAAEADILVETLEPGALARLGLGAEALHARNPALVITSITDFGQTGPYRDYQATHAVLMALGGVLARSGLKGQRPLLPPGQLAHETAAVQAAWATLMAYLQALRTGRGDHLDFSVLDATVQVIDPGMGVTGSAAAGRSALELAPRGRPPMGTGYPILRCADGYVRICVLNPRQWQGMCAWLGDEHPFTDPSYGHIGKRFKVIKEINALIAALFRDQPAAELVREGQKRGVPIAAVATPAHVLRDEQFLAREAFAAVPLPGGRQGLTPRGYLFVDGSPAGIRTPAPELGAEGVANEAPRPTHGTQAAARPLAGLRVLDLGVIVAGAELGRLLADQGAEVIKIESSAFPDGLRQGQGNEAMTISFAQGSRGKCSLGLNLRSPRGVALFKQLAAASDVVVSNFKPGTMESLGLGYEVLKAINPRLVFAVSSAFGATGPRSRSMGYGPLVRASAGLTALWRYPEIEGSFSDSTTIVPDHFVGRISATAIAALLIRRLRTGAGGFIDVAQAEAGLGVLATELLRESLQPGSVGPRGNADEFEAPHGVFPCAGDDEWCVVAVRDGCDFAALCEAIGRRELLADPRFADSAGRVAHREELEAAVAEWTAQRTPQQVMETLQSQRVPAARMLRLDEYLQNPHFAARRLFRTFQQPGLAAPMITEAGPVAFSRLPEPELRPAPFLAQHSEEIARTVLGLSEAEIEELVAEGVLETMGAELRALLEELPVVKAAA
ncbi:CaiB/BaiF CoA-transferase family protein [Pelomonas sp. KK5]|uniref:CaiB/BaiF CoA transferase family protein n=1 Tax=Pelomonas sp. KK5 TaxID=1855730 RepID=UPI00097BC0E1|nr:CoA transferase [Pelomonas sp. KK5]